MRKDKMKRNITSALCLLLTVISLSTCQLSSNKKLVGNAISRAAQEVLQDENSSNSSAADQDADGTEEVQDDKSSDAANPACGLPEVSKSTPEKILKRFAYTCSFNPENNIPNWVAWELTADHTDGPYKRGGIKFQEDEGVTTYDYTRSGYDRGHMCPSGDNKWSEEAQEESFLMTNMCPQVHGLNAGDWNEMEMQCRRWAGKFGCIDIMAGPILFKGRHKTIGEADVVVPEAFFKVVYCPSKKMAIGFIYRNEDGNRPKGDYVNSVAQIERITGIKFLTSLPAKEAQKVKTEANLDDWY